MVTEWNNVQVLLDSGLPVFGDRIEIERSFGLYQHWALSLGGETVVNFRQGPGDEMYNLVVPVVVTKPGTEHGEIKQEIKIMSEALYVVVGSSKVRINNGDDEKHFSSQEDWPTMQEVQANISEFQVKWPKYDLINNNCECFVNYARYGERYSDQTQVRAILKQYE